MIEFWGRCRLEFPHMVKFQTDSCLEIRGMIAPISPEGQLSNHTEDNHSIPVLMDIGNTQVETPQKLSPEERERCMREGFCLRCRKPNHIAKNCPKGHPSQPVPMSIGKIQSEKLQKLTPEERERCMKEGLCLRCRKQGHIAKNCPKGCRN